jgi:hypothetical protein
MAAYFLIFIDMTLEGIINIINENLKEERKKVNINGKGIFKVEEHFY